MQVIIFEGQNDNYASNVVRNVSLKFIIKGLNMLNSIEVFVIIMALAIVGASVAACITKNLDAFWFPVILIVCYLTCGNGPNFDKEPETNLTTQKAQNR